MQTAHLDILHHSRAHLRALYESKEAYEQFAGRRVADGLREMFLGPEVSADFLARIKTDGPPDFWHDGFIMVDRAEEMIVGACGFKGPPDGEGAVEISYGLAPAFWGRGYATEAARALTEYAFEFPEVRIVRAHTLPEKNASTSVLTKCDFAHLGEVIEPDDGRVWRWETQRKDR